MTQRTGDIASLKAEADRLSSRLSLLKAGDINKRKPRIRITDLSISILSLLFSLFITFYSIRADNEKFKSSLKLHVQNISLQLSGLDNSLPVDADAMDDSLKTHIIILMDWLKDFDHQNNDILNYYDCQIAAATSTNVENYADAIYYYNKALPLAENYIDSDACYLNLATNYLIPPETRDTAVGRKYLELAENLLLSKEPKSETVALLAKAYMSGADLYYKLNSVEVLKYLDQTLKTINRIPEDDYYRSEVIARYNQIILDQHLNLKIIP
jgi:hypothetical protein